MARWHRAIVRDVRELAKKFPSKEVLDGDVLSIERFVFEFDDLLHVIVVCSLDEVVDERFAYAGTSSSLGSGWVTTIEMAR